MANNDMSVIMYKILRYMYECLKQGKQITYEDICYNCEMFHIPEAYWITIMKELINRGYVTGIYEVKTIGHIGIKIGSTAAITYEGVQFLDDNSGMKKAAECLGTPFETVLGSIISRLI